MDGNHNINNIPRDKNRENKTANTNTEDHVADLDNTDNDDAKISIEDNYLKNLDPSLRNSIDDITAAINTNLGNYDISTKHKASIQTQIEGLANLIKSIPRKTDNAITTDDSALSNNAITTDDSALSNNAITTDDSALSNNASEPTNQMTLLFLTIMNKKPSLLLIRPLK